MTAPLTASLGVLLLAVLLMVAGSAVDRSVDGSGGSLQGDADCSGLVNPVDGLRILRQDADLGDVPCVAAADVNCDDAVNPLDGLLLLRFDAGLSITLITGCAPIGDPLEEATPTPHPEHPSSSLELIEAALEAGEIDEETALSHKVFSIFGDPRLPAIYQGADETEHVPATTVMFELFGLFSTLSPGAQATLQPFMIPPFSEGSWFEPYRLGASAAMPAGTSVCDAPPTPPTTPSPSSTPTESPAPPQLEFVPDDKLIGAATANGKYKIWWPVEFPQWETRARLVLQYLDTGLHETVSDTLGREPLDDSELTFGDGPETDIFYVEVPVPLLGLALPLKWINEDNVGKKTPSAMLINGCFEVLDAGVDWIELTTAHETFHAAHLAFDMVGVSPDSPDSIKQWLWLLESTSKWFEDFRYPDSNQNQHGWDDVFKHPHDRIDDPNKTRLYSGYVWFFFLTRKHGPEVIAQIFANRETMTHFAAIDAAIPGGWRENYPEFVPNLWNEPPVDLFRREDGIDLQAATRGLIGVPHGVGLKEHIFLPEGESEKEFGAAITEVQFLSAHMYRFVVGTPLSGPVSSPSAAGAGDLASIQFHNPLGESVPAYVTIQAVYRVAGQQEWVLEDWTETPGKAFCLSLPGQQLQELLLIVTNTDWQGQNDSPAFTERVAVARDTCGWTGEAHLSEHRPPGTLGLMRTTHATELVYMPVVGEIPRLNNEDWDEGFEIVSGTITHEVSGSFRRDSGPNSELCPAEGTVTVSVERGDSLIVVRQAEPEGLEYAGFGTTPVVVPVISHCPSGDFPGHVSIDYYWFATGGRRTLDPNLLEGSFEEAMEDATSTRTWRFTR